MKADRASGVGLLPCLAVFLLALALRLVYLHQIGGNPFFDSPVIDALGYDQDALRISEGNWLWNKAFQQAPLYSYFLAAVYRLFGHDYYLPRLFQAILGSLSCVLVLLIGGRAFGPRTGLWAGLAAAGYGTLIFYDGELLRTSLITSLALLSLLALLRAADEPTAGRWALSGLLLGLSALAKESILLFVPLVMLWVLLRPGTARVLLRHGLVLLLAMLAVILPVTARTYAVTGDLVLISALGGLNFYLGNNPGADRTVLVQPGVSWNEMLTLPARTAGVRDPAGQSAWFYRQSFRFIRENPGAWMGMMARKLVLFWNAHETDPNNDLEYFRKQSPLLRLLLQPGWWIAIPFGLIAPLAFSGMVLRGGEPGARRLLLLFIFASMAAVVIFHVRARYRLPMVPALIVFAAFAAGRLAELARQRNFRELLKPVAVLLPALVLVNADFYQVRETPGMPLHYNLGIAHLNRGRFPEAAAELSRAVRESPADADMRNGLAFAYLRTGRPEAAVEEWRTAIALQPDHAPSHNNLGKHLAMRGLREEAEVEYRKALEILPDYTTARINLGLLCLETGRHGEALAQFREVARIDPDSAGAAHYLAAVALLAGKRYREAADEFETALRYDPSNVKARQGRDQALRNSGTPY